MVKKRLASGESCNKCAQAEAQLRRRGLWDRIDKVVWAVAGETDSLGWELARRHQVEAAPFYIVGGVVDGAESLRVFTSTLDLIREVLEPELEAAREAASTPEVTPKDLDASDALEVLEVLDVLDGKEPQEILDWALTTHGGETAIAFSGAEDVVLIHMAAQLGKEFTAITVDTGRLHPETYEFIDWVRERFGFELIVTAPDRQELEAMTLSKGLFSFYRDGHAECCDIRKVKPLKRALAGRPAWITGQRRDQSATTRSTLPVVQVDEHLASDGATLFKFNPLAAWSAEKVWSFIHDNDLPHNPLHGRGFASIGCAPCTRPILPGQSPREGRWWWEGASAKECGLHAQNLGRKRAGSTDAPDAPDEPET